MMKMFINIIALLSLTIPGLCQCDNIIIENKKFQSDFATEILTANEFYSLTSEQNKALWFSELESPMTTSFTKLWDSYHENNYRITQSDFIKHYQGIKEISIAFQLGPNILNMSSYDIFLIKPIGNCFLIIRTYVSHDRINSKTYSVIDKNIMEGLQNLLKINLIEVTNHDKLLGERKERNTLFLVNNLENKTYWLNVFNEYSESDEEGFMPLNEPNPKVDELISYLDSKIQWIESY